MNTTTTDAIRKDIVLKAPRDRVWRALSDPAEFGAWFKVDLSGPRGHAVRDRRRSNRGAAIVLVPLAPLQPGAELRLLERADDAHRVHARGGRWRHEAHRHRVRLRRHPARAPRRILPHEQR